MRRHAFKIVIAILIAGWLIGRGGPVPRTVEWQLLSIAGECRQVGRTADELVGFRYSSGDFPKHAHIEFTRHAGHATLTVTEWGLLDDATSAWRTVYHLEDSDSGLTVVDCSYENACWREPFGLGGTPCS